MAHYAKVTDGIVESVIVAEADFIETLEGTWIQTSYNTEAGEHSLGGTPLRKNYAGIGYVYDSGRDAFYLPQPYASWTLNESSCLWEPPIAYPEDTEKEYNWDEDAYQADNNSGWVAVE